MNITNFFKSDRYASLLRYLSFAFLGLIIFGAGIYVGHRATEFSYNWGNNYYRDFGGPHSPFMMTSDTDELSPMPHGAFGTIIGINLPSLAVKGPNEAEKMIMLGTTTLIKSVLGNASTSDLHLGSNVIIIGQPDGQGRISAALIRIISTSTSN